MSENEEVKEVKESKKNRKKLDKSQIAIKIMAFILAIAMILPIIISGIYALQG